MLVIAWKHLHSIKLPTTWPWVLSYGGLIVAASKGLDYVSSFIDPKVPIHVEVLLPAFVLVAAQVVPGSNVNTRRTGLNPTRSAALEVIRLSGGSMGISPAGSSLNEPFGDLSSRGSRLRGVALDGELLERSLDELPALLVLGARARGVTEIAAPSSREAAERLSAMAGVLRAFGVPVVFDVTHSLQLPGGLGNATGGQSEYIEPLARAGVACGVDAVFMEVHDCPEKALSDGPNALPLHRMAPLLSMIRDIHELVRNSNSGNPR